MTPAIRPQSVLISVLLLALFGCAVNPVTGKNELSFMSAQQEIAVGEKNYRPSRQSQGGDYYLNPKLQAYVAGVGRKLAAVSGQPDLPYDFVVLNNSVPNAWALPGGKIAINRGLLVYLEDESQLAAVLAHEVVHAAANQFWVGRGSDWCSGSAGRTTLWSGFAVGDSGLDGKIRSR